MLKLRKDEITYLAGSWRRCNTCGHLMIFHVAAVHGAGRHSSCLMPGCGCDDRLLTWRSGNDGDELIELIPKTREAGQG